MLCYEENTKRMEKSFDPLRCDAVGSWGKHFFNSLYLTFMLQNGTMSERHQASKELPICERKMKYWERQPHFDRQQSATLAIKMKRDWER